MATKKIAAPANPPVVVAAEPVVEKPSETPKAPAVKAPKAPPATKAAAAKAAPKPAARAKTVEEKVKASKAALAAALEKVKAVKLTPRTATPAKVPKDGKPAKGDKARKANKPTKDAKPVKAPKVKLVRDSFTMPEPEYVTLAALKKRLQGAGAPAKKSELLRAGVALLAGLKDADLAAALAKVEKIKTGRPAKAPK